MNKTMLKCAIFGGFVVFLWGIISWMVLPWHQMMMNKFQDEKKVADVIQENAPKSGVYMIPNCVSSDIRVSKEEMAKSKIKTQEMMQKGPIVYAIVQKEGMGGGMAGQFVTGLIVNIIAAFFVTWLLTMTKAMAYMKQVYFVTGIGFTAGLMVFLPDWVWMGMTFASVIVHLFDLIIAWFLAGLVIAKFAKK
ncbi:MAG: hypothetical protein ACHQT8_02590 [Chlamydiales bacterium]